MVNLKIFKQNFFNFQVILIEDYQKSVKDVNQNITGENLHYIGCPNKAK